MPVFSTLRQTSRIMIPKLFSKQSPKIGGIVKREAGHGGTFEIKGSSWNDSKATDMFYFYSCIAAVLYGSIILYANIFIGPAQLVEIPEGYRPKHWEYYEHPIARFFQRYCFDDPQMLHETYLHELYEEDVLMKIRDLDSKVDRVMKKNKDYKAYYYRPISAEWMRREQKDMEKILTLTGENLQNDGFPSKFEDKEGQLELEFANEFPEGMVGPRDSES